MMYTEEVLIKLETDLREIPQMHSQLSDRIMQLKSHLDTPAAQEYLIHGVSRRFSMLKRCVENIFRLFPPEARDILAHDARIDAEINLHCFVLNIHGLLDNLPWVIVHERKILENDLLSFSKKDVGLYKKKSQELFNQEFREYLNEGNTSKWFKNYQQRYRDALAHRIPIYIPPFRINESDEGAYRELDRQISELRLNRPSDPQKIDEYIHRIRQLQEEQHRFKEPIPCFTHSLNEEAGFISLHIQVVTDFFTVVEIMDKFMDYLK